MPHEFTEWPYEPEPQPSSQMGRRPPGRYTAAGLLDPGEQVPASAEPKPFTMSEILRLVAILIAGSGAAALIGYMIWMLTLK